MKTIHTLATELGFESWGITAAVVPQTYPQYQQWIADGCHAGMEYLAQHSCQRMHPNGVLSGAKSVLVFAVSYSTVFADHRKEFPFSSPMAGFLTVPNYAAGIDYHLWMRPRLQKMTVFLSERFSAGNFRAVVDTAPVMERQFCVNAGVGWFGKNTMVIHPTMGSRWFIGLILSTVSVETMTAILEFSPVSPPCLLGAGRCDTCSCCVESCPTGALSAYHLDARRCLNYWTIESKAPIPPELAVLRGDQLFGCDVCQDVCPWNPPIPESEKCRISSAELSAMTEQEFDARYGDTPLARVGLARLQRCS